MFEYTFLTTHIYEETSKPPHIFTSTVIAENRVLAMEYMKQRYSADCGYKSELLQETEYPCRSTKTTK